MVGKITTSRFHKEVLSPLPDRLAIRRPGK
jgi:hypothetical protein